MDIYDQYATKIQHEIALLKTGKANYAILSQVLIIFEIPDNFERVYESWKDDSDNCRIRGWAILARMNSYNSDKWQEVPMQSGAEHLLIQARTTWTKSERKMRAMTSHKIINGDWLK